MSRRYIVWTIDGMFVCWCRFDMVKMHSKVNKPVNFPANLNLRQFMSNKQVSVKVNY